MCLIVGPLAAQSVWNVSNGNWNATGSWAGGVLPVSGPELHLRFNATGAYTSTNNLGPMVLNRLTVNNTSNSTLTLAAAVGNTLSFEGANPTLDITGITRFTGWLTGAGTITKTGSGTFIHDSDNKEFTGTLIIDAGRFSNWGGTSSTPLVTNFNPVSIVVNDGGTYQFGNAGAGDPNLPVTTYITANNGGTVNWQESQAFGGIHLQGGTVELVSGNATANGTTAQSWTHGTLTGNAVTGTAYALNGSAPINKTTSGTVTLTGAAAITGTGGLRIQEGSVVIPHAVNLGTTPLTFGDVGKTGTLEYQGATATRAGNITRATSGTGVIQVTQPSTILTMTGTQSGMGMLIKSGPGALHLTGTMGSTGQTRVNEGLLRVNPGVASGPFAVAASATLAVNVGESTASLSVPSLNLMGSTSTLHLEMGGFSVPTQPLVIVRNANGFIFSNSATLKVSNSQPFLSGTYLLMDYDGNGIESGLNLQLSGRTLGSLVYDTENTQILLNVTGTDTVKWTGTASSLWDIGSAAGVGGSQNWKLVTGGTATNFINTDSVTFDNTASNFTVQLTGPVQPQSLVVDAAADYRFTGAGEITGATSLSKMGSGKLVLATDNDYSGGTSVSGGSLQLGEGGASGSFTGPFFMNNGVLAFNRSDNFMFDNVTNLAGTNTLRQEGAGTVRVEARLALGTATLNFDGNGTGSLDMVGAITGSGILNKNGSSHLNLLGSHGFTGTLNINGGTVQLTDLGESGDLNAASIVVNNGGTFIFGPGGNPDLPATTMITVNEGGLFDLRTGESYGGIVLNGGEYRVTTSGNTGVSSSAEAATPGKAVFDLRSGSITTAITSTGNGGLLNQSGGGVLAKTTSGTVTVGAGVSVAPSLAVHIREGTLSMLPANVPATGTAVVAGGALANFELGSDTSQGTLQIYGTGTATSARAVSVGAGGGRVEVVEPGTVLTFSGAVSGNGPLVKSGAGTLNLYGSLGSSGMTMVSEGLLRLKPGTAAGGLTVAGGGTLAVLNEPVVASLNVPALMLASGSTLQMELNTASLPGVPLINVTGSNGLSVIGDVLLRLTNAKHYITGVYPLLDYAGSPITSGFALQLEGRATGTLVYDTVGTKINASIVQGEEVRWTGGTSGVWDVGSAVNVGGSLNWKTAVSQANTNFVQADFVNFEDGASRLDVNVTDIVRPNGVRVNSTSNYVFSGSGKISGTASLTKEGSGLLVLATDNDYTGGTFVNGGQLQLGNGGSAGSFAGAVTLSGGALVFNRSNAYTHSGAMVLNAGSSLIQSGSGAVTLSGALTVNAPVSLVQNGSGPLTVTPAMALGTHSLTVTGSGNITLSGVVSGSNTQPVVMNGNGILYLPATNTFTGTTVINRGTVSVSTNRGLGDANADVLINGGTLQLTANNLGAVTAAARNITIGAAGGTLDFRTNQNFQGNGFFGTGNVVKKGQGEWSVGSNGSTFSGEILIQEGSLMMTSAQLNSAKNLTVAAGAQFAINDDTAGTWLLAAGGKFSFTGDGGGTGALRQYNGSSGAAAANTFTTTFGREVVVAGASALVNTVAERGTILITSNVTGPGLLVKTGPGTLALSGSANSYSGGTQINAGTLLISNTAGSGTGSGQVIIGSGGKLMGTGSLSGPTTIQAGGMVQGGNSGTRGTLTFTGTLTMDAGSQADFRLGANGSNDKLVVGSLSLDTSATLRVILGYAPVAGDSFDLFDWTALAMAGASEVNWAGQLDFSAAVLGESLFWDTSLFNSLGVISVAVIPEPSRLLLLGACLAIVTLRRRRTGY